MFGIGGAFAGWDGSREEALVRDGIPGFWNWRVTWEETGYEECHVDGILFKVWEIGGEEVDGDSLVTCSIFQLTQNHNLKRLR